MIADTPTIVYIVLDIILGLFVVCSNLLVCYVVICSNNLRKKAMYIFVTSLAMADICVGLTAVPFGILTKLGLPLNSPRLCIAMLSSIVISTQISIFNIMAIAIERYLAICHPRIHYTKFTPTRSVYIIIITWCVASLVGCLPLLGWNKIENFESTQIPTEQINATIGERQEPTESTPSPVHIGNFRDVFFEDDSSNHRHCKFMQIMDENYMFFNFSVCVLPPLLTCVVLYFIIFMSLVHNKLPSDHLIELSKYSSPKVGNKTAAMLPRKSSACTKKKLRAIYLNNSNGATQQVKMLLDFQLKKNSIDTETANDEKKKKNQNATKKVGNSSTENSSDDSWIPLHAASSPKKAKDMNTKIISNRIKTLEHIQRCHSVQDVFKHKFNHFLEDSVNSNRSSCASTPILIRSMSSSRLDLEEYRKKKRQSNHLKSKKEIHAATVLGLIVLCFVLCWMPIHVLNTIHRFDINHTIFIPIWLFDVGVLLSHTNSAVNFFLYSWRLKAFRKQLRRVTVQRISRA